MQVTVSTKDGSALDHWLSTILLKASKLDRLAMGLLRASLVVVLLWIGGLKFVNYEADSIVPLVANSPAMRFLYRHPAEYHTHTNKEGELKPLNREWRRQNGTYTFSHLLGAVIVSLGLLIAVYPLSPRSSALGSFLLILMSCTTLSFLITTPKAWVPPLGDINSGFPYLSGVGRLIVKDFTMLAAAIVTFVDSARTITGKVKAVSLDTSH